MTASLRSKITWRSTEGIGFYRHHPNPGLDIPFPVTPVFRIPSSHAPSPRRMEEKKKLRRMEASQQGASGLFGPN